MSGSIWSPTRESASTLAFMATLRLHSPAWEWADTPHQARWWLVDATSGQVDSSTLAALATHYDGLTEKPRVAFLAAQLGQLPRPSWTFFKPPVKSGLIFNWVRPPAAAVAVVAAAAAAAAAEASTAVPRAAAAAALPPWRQGQLRLRRWPNISRYGNRLELTVACSRLLSAPASYEQVLQWSVPAELLDRLLADALRDGLLHIEGEAAPAAALPLARATAGLAAAVAPAVHASPGVPKAQGAPSARWGQAAGPAERAAPIVTRPEASQGTLRPASPQAPRQATPPGSPQGPQQSPQQASQQVAPQGAQQGTRPGEQRALQPADPEAPLQTSPQAPLQMPPQTPPAVLPEAERSRWDLVKRLLGKFAFK